ncbi:hypothetical protein CTAYLR_008187 [Chrysophaeum taylorii]|uniref:E2 ubiquitin-conjugating enzyme n=1 Tax=Chrysophaeum taylorii TaxID=2483200 RepID=A0AAD7UBC0_9STRA|nr:hypothetical protein CTAYLR_008187 [Chrysophaeum taylorii]
MNDLAVKRLQREYNAIRKSPIPNITARPLESNILEWHYVIEGTQDTPYEGGFYHGKLKFPTEYPLRPPAVLMMTPSGRFKTNRRLCLSMSDFHPESWNPMWSVSTILTGLYSFMLENHPTLGSIDATHEQRRRLAAQSLAFNCADSNFRDLFSDLVDLHDQRQQRVSDQPADLHDLPAPNGPAAAAAAADMAHHNAGEPRPLCFLACVGATLALLALVFVAHYPS